MPTRTPATSVIAFDGPVLPVNFQPSSRARLRIISAFLHLLGVSSLNFLPDSGSYVF